MKLNLIKYFLTILITTFVWSCNLESPLINNNKTLIIKSETKWKISTEEEKKLYKIFLKEYQSNGKLSKVTEFLQTGNIKSLTQFSYQNYISYEETKFYNGDNSVDSIQTNIYVHNLIGEIERKISLSKDGDTSCIIEYSYDQKGNLIKKVQKDLISHSSIVTDIQYFYNNEGNIIGRVINPNLNGTYESRDSIAYQSEGVKIELYNYDREGNINIIYTYYYNKFGKIYKEFQSTKDGKIIGKYEYEYSYWN